MKRAVIYSLLFCVIVFSAYLTFEQTREGPPLIAREERHDLEPPRPSVSPLPAQPSRAREIPPETSLTETQNIVSAGDSTGQAKEKDHKTASEAAEKFRSGDYEGAAELYAELSERDRDALGPLGACYFRLGDYDSAEKVLEQAVKHNPDDFSVRKLLAVLAYEKDDTERGLLHAEAGLSLRNDPELLRLFEKLRNDKKSAESSESESSAHFRVVFDGYKHGAISRKVLEILEDAYRSVGKELGHFPSTKVTTVLYTGRDFRDITRSPEWSSGVYDGKIRIPVRGVEGSEALLRKVLFHEYAHAVVHSLTPRCPQWIHEGLAEHFSGSYQKKTGQVIPLRQLESFAWLSGKYVPMAYWESYSAVSFLIETHGLYRVKEFLRSLSTGADIEEAFKRAFGQSYSEFISTWGKS